MAKARALGWDAEAAPDEALAVAVAQRLKPVADEPRAAALTPHREQIRQWLSPEDGGRGLRLSKVHVLLGRQGVAVPYSSLHRFAVGHLGFQERRRTTVRVAEGAPGEVAEVDFGRLGLVPDPAKAGTRRVVHAPIVTLVYSRHQYVYVTPSQQIPALVAGLEDAWAYFGGVTARVVLDNLRAAIAKADRYEPVFARTFDEYARHRGFVIDAAVVRHPTGKPHVERRSRSSMIPSSPRAPSIASPTTPTRSPSKARATASASGPARPTPCPGRPARPRSADDGDFIDDIAGDRART